MIDPKAARRNREPGNIEDRRRADVAAQDFNLYRRRYVCRGSGM